MRARCCSRLDRRDLSNAAFPFGTSRVIDLGYARVRATRITYVGELGWELLHPDRVRAGGLRRHHRGGRCARTATCRLSRDEFAANGEGFYRSWGHDITDEDTPLEAGLGFAVAWSKPGGFIGRDALLRQRDVGMSRRLACFALKHTERLPFGNEPIWRDGRLVGRTTSGAFGYTLGRPLALGYIEANGERLDPRVVATGRFEIDVAGERLEADASLRPFHDPERRCVRA